MDRLRNLSGVLLLSFGKSDTTDKSNEEEGSLEVAGSDVGSGLPELATTRNTGRDILQAVDENRSSEDEDDDAFPNSNGKPIVKEEA